MEMGLDIIGLFSTGAIGLSVFVVLWAVSLLVEDASIVDPYWGMSFVVLALIAADVSPYGFSASHWLVLGLTLIWGLRLSLYLGWRNLGHGEDKRYRRMRDKRGDAFPLWSLYGVFILQWGIGFAVGLPVTVTLLSPDGGLGVLAVLGALVWLVGFVFETLGDWQLARFKADPANTGKVMDQGLWRYTRHPNYFGDACVWWGLGLIAAGAGHWWTLAGSALMTLFLVNVSGKALLEKDLKNRPAYADYIARTSGFVPRPPRGA